MAATEVNVQMQQRRDTAAGWTSADPTLLSGELGYETDTGKFKIGDGSTAWSSLSYVPAFSISAHPLATADIADDAITGDKLANDITIANDLTVTNDLKVTNDVGIGTTSPAVELDVSGQIRASTGILFGTDTATANTLSDYEEGTWTPTVTGATTAGTATYTQQHGSYEKIGGQVTVRGFVEFNSHTGTGTLQIEGLPFASHADAFDGIQPGAAMVADLTFPSGHTSVTVYLANNLTNLYLYGSKDAATYTAFAMSAAGATIFSITYRTDA